MLDACFQPSDFFGASEKAAIDLISRRSNVTDEIVLLAVGLAVWSHRNGQPCVDLEEIQPLVFQNYGLSFPAGSVLVQHLLNTPSVVIAVESNSFGDVPAYQSDTRPLVLFENLLFTQRQFVDELSIAHNLKTRANQSRFENVDHELVGRLLPIPAPDDEAARAVGDDGIAHRVGLSVLSQKITVLTGGPGTGKTHALTRCLAAYLESRNGVPTSVALVAPTGKAATRAKELITQFVMDQSRPNDSSLVLSNFTLEILKKIEPMTIQRVLKNKERLQTRFFYDSTRRLPYDIVIVDEMSMVPSYLMARLLEAIDETSTVLLVGDEAQLESVESGSVLREIVESSKDDNSLLAGSVFELKRVWRQSSDTKIGDLARLIRAGQAEDAFELASKNPSGIKFVPVLKNQQVPHEVIEQVVTSLTEACVLASSQKLEDHARALALIEQNKVLCGPREGQLGIGVWNKTIQSKVQQIDDGEIMRPGTPLLVTINSPRTRLVNGAIGVVVNWLSDDGENEIRIFFKDDTGGRYLSIAELPPVEICYAMTIHKSQGSEYSNVVVILPDENSPLCTRELIYTAITRAKKSVTVVGNKESFVGAVNQVSVRTAGVGTLLKALSKGR